MPYAIQITLSSTGDITYLKNESQVTFDIDDAKKFSSEDAANDFFNKALQNYDLLEMGTPSLIEVAGNADSGCYIATACFGDIDHPVVVDFRTFRDNVLSQSLWGQRFIKTYNKFSPTLSRLIKKYTLLESISRYMLIKLHTFTCKQDSRTKSPYQSK